jgi:hypothetical protein
MRWKKWIRDLCDILSLCGLFFVLKGGFDKAFSGTATHQHWVGYLMLGSALALAYRLRTTRKAYDAESRKIASLAGKTT